MTPQEAQRAAELLGYPWIALDGEDGKWGAHTHEPELIKKPYWVCKYRHSKYIELLTPIDYTGPWEDSLHGPEE